MVINTLTIMIACGGRTDLLIQAKDLKHTISTSLLPIASF